jgi:Secretion system C-terminal sorting domain
MKKLLLFLLPALFPLFVQAQIWYPNGIIYDSVIFRFSIGDSLSTSFGEIVMDTSSPILWQIGSTIKPVFSHDTIAVRGIMTDTLNPYPSNANDFFLLKMQPISTPNVIIDFWHKYQTDSLHAGGIVEFSLDTGNTWVNIGDCPNVRTQNFYTASDTIVSGQAAFTGTSNGEQLTRFQFLNCFTEKTTNTSCFDAGDYGSLIYIRFRFVSDSTIDSLAGWIIDSIKIENPGCVPGAVGIVTKQNTISVFPNPATDDITIACASNVANITITNIVGQIVYRQKCNGTQVNVGVNNWPVGMYFVKINDGEVRSFLKE